MRLFPFGIKRAMLSHEYCFMSLFYLAIMMGSMILKPDVLMMGSQIFDFCCFLMMGSQIFDCRTEKVSSALLFSSMGSKVSLSTCALTVSVAGAASGR
jgi:hypothetical protein